jgi:hypothetical protein
MVSYSTNQIILPEHVFNDLNRFICKRYQKSLPNSLLIAQAFLLKYPDYGKKYGLSAINYAIEDGIKRELF